MAGKDRKKVLLIEDLEALRTVVDPTHRKIFRIVKEKGECDLNSFCDLLSYPRQEIEDYLEGLVYSGFLLKKGDSPNPTFEMAIRDYNISGDLLDHPEGADLIRELLVDQAAEIAQEVIHITSQNVPQAELLQIN